MDTIGGVTTSSFTEFGEIVERSPGNLALIAQKPLRPNVNAPVFNGALTFKIYSVSSATTGGTTMTGIFDFRMSQEIGGFYILSSKSLFLRG